MNGLPLLSRPPPDNTDADESACRKCNKEFNFLFARQKRCNHCGYAYCSSCTDYQALMPRVGPDTGYEALPVCGFCMEMLSITACSRNKLRNMPLAKLRPYMKAYDIRTSGTALEKDDLVDAIVRAKSVNGCLLPAHEDFYRKNSVPSKHGDRSRPRNIFSRSSRQEPAPAPTPAPAPPPQPRQRQYAPPPGPPPQHARAGPPPPPPQPRYERPGVPPPQTHFPQPQYHRPPSVPQHSRPGPRHAPPSPSASNFQPSASQTNFHARSPGAYSSENPPRPRQPPPRPRSAAPTVPTTPRAPPQPVPSLDSLLQKSPDEIANLSISTLKSILFENRVNTGLGVLEKEDLVRKVLTLVTDERRDREIKEREEREEAERMEWARRDREREEEERRAAEQERRLMQERQHNNEATSTDEEAASQSTDNDKPKPAPTPGPSSPPYSDRTQDGLCVICQDEHATMAIIDCGHLALCKSCSEIVMQSTRECPLCRTRIVTEQRLLRIFKT